MSTKEFSNYAKVSDDTFVIELKVYSPIGFKGARFVQAIVDPHRTYSVFPRKLMDELGAPFLGTKLIHTPEGEEHFEIYFLDMEYARQRDGHEICVSTQIDTPVLGSPSISAMGFRADPARKDLVTAYQRNYP